MALSAQRKNEGFTYSNGFLNKLVYTDEHNSQATTVTTSGDDQGFKGPLKSIRRAYRYKANYESGFCSFVTPKERTKFDNFQIQRIALLDCDTFLDYFSRPAEVAKTLEKKARELLTEWRRIHGNKEHVGRRRAVDRSEEIGHYDWTTKDGRRERSVYQWTLSTYGHTERVNDLPAPKIELGDLKFMIKLKSTVGADDIPDKAGGDPEGFRLDHYGYNVKFLHFLGLLRSEEFKKLVRDTADDVGSSTAPSKAGQEPSETAKETRPPLADVTAAAVSATAAAVNETRQEEEEEEEVRSSQEPEEPAEVDQ